MWIQSSLHQFFLFYFTLTTALGGKLGWEGVYQGHTASIKEKIRTRVSQILFQQSNYIDRLHLT